MDRRKGKFRSFLLASLKHYMANEWDRAQTVKRGGEYRFTSFDALGGENRYQEEPVSNLTAERIYERRWALTLLERTLEKLQREYVSGGKAALFDALQPYLTKGEAAACCRELGRTLGLSEGAAKVAVHRFRRRYGEILQAQVAQTVASPEEIEEELRHLFAVLSH